MDRYPLLTHAHDPAAGEAPVRWTCIEGRPEPGVVERIHTVEYTGAQLLSRVLMLPHKVLVLPGVARYTGGHGLTSLAIDGAPAAKGVLWDELERGEHAARNRATAYWSHIVRIYNPSDAKRYSFSWIDREIMDQPRGLREAHCSASGAVLWDDKARFPRKTVDICFPNGVAWDALPAGYKIEIWRKTKHKQTPGADVITARNGVRWMLWNTVDAAELSINLDQICRITAGISTVGTKAFRFAYLRPDGTRSMLSCEVAVYHNRENWGPNNTFGPGRVRIK